MCLAHEIDRNIGEQQLQTLGRIDHALDAENLHVEGRAALLEIAAGGAVVEVPEAVHVAVENALLEADRIGLGDKPAGIVLEAHTRLRHVTCGS